jgi:hypothetical protein
MEENMRKTGFTIILIFLLIFAQSIVAAGPYDDAFTGASFSVLAEFSGDDIGTFQMRGFAVSPDGAFLYGGCLQGDKRVLKIDASNGRVVGEYSDSVEPGFPKGLAADDRGYFYVGIANQANDGAVRYSIVNAATMTEEYVTDISIDGKVGINGAAVKNFNGKYILYFITNYGPNFIYSFDVTDVKNPVPNAGFGNGGIVDLNALMPGGNEGSYMDVDSAGNVYISYNMGGGSKGDTLYKLSPDGKSILTKVAITEAYGVNVVKDDYILVSTYSGDSSAVYVLNAGDLSQVAKIAEMDDAANYSMAAFGGGKIYVADHGYGGNGDRILVSTVLNIPEPVQEAPAAVDTPEEPEVPAPAPAQTATTPAPRTADPIVLIAIGSVISAAGVLIARKRK